MISVKEGNIVLEKLISKMHFRVGEGRLARLANDRLIWWLGYIVFFLIWNHLACSDRFSLVSPKID